MKKSASRRTTTTTRHPKDSTRRSASSASRRTTPHTKYLFVVGGVMSGVGKGVTASSIACVLKARGLTVTALKIDPYINVDAGTMNPTEHGEVFVLHDGLETDQDMGNYERFLGQSLPGKNYMTTGSVYLSVIKKERNLEYGGKNVEVVPDIPLEVIRRIKTAATDAGADVALIEVGGTVGEYQNILFLEAIRLMKQEAPADVATVMVSYLPVPGSIGEMKTKPTQTAVRTLNSAGVFADLIIARGPVPVDDKRKAKIATFCNVRQENVISAPDVASIYEIPLNFEKDNLSARLCDLLGIRPRPSDLTSWKRFVARAKADRPEVTIAVVGKYFTTGDFMLADVYLSVIEALKYSAYQLNLKPKIVYRSSADFTDGKRLRELNQYDGILVPGGFGATGIPGKLKVIEYARSKGIPYFGICYGMQLAVLEYAQNVLGLKNASTEEIDPTAKDLVVHVMDDQRQKLATGDLGGTMRLGKYPAVLQVGSIARAAYKMGEIVERHRHRYEINNAYVDLLTKQGLVFSGTSPDGNLMEIMELPKAVHPFFVGTQFHPEFLARPLAPHPLFTAFVKAAYERTPKGRRR